MSADIVNLRNVRKVKARADAEKQADENRVKFGRSKAEKSLSAATKNLIIRVGSYIKHASQNIQLFKILLNGDHILWRIGLCKCINSNKYRNSKQQDTLHIQ